MQRDLYAKFAPIIRGLAPTELGDRAALRAKLRIATDGDLEICYAPLEYLNLEAKVVVVGITPGFTQMVNAVCELRRQLIAGVDTCDALRAAKLNGGFSGGMRPNLVALLDRIGLNEALGIDSCGEFFGASSRMAHTTSMLRNPVFLRGGNYNGEPNMLKHPLLRRQLMELFGRDLAANPGALLVPLGDRVADALHWLASEGVVSRDRILAGLPHPSGANGERIAYFLGKKSRSALSLKTHADSLDRSRELLASGVSKSNFLTQLRTAAEGV